MCDSGVILKLDSNLSERPKTVRRSRDLLCNWKTFGLSGSVSIQMEQISYLSYLRQRKIIS